ncbi:F-box only protein 9-like [Glandiceps talaboti]
MASNELIVPVCDATEEEEEEEEDDPGKPSLEVELANFREQWQAELADGTNTPPLCVKRNIKNKKDKEQDNAEEEARYLYLQGANAEKNGDLYEAIRYYKQAVHLVPDIEFKITDYVGKSITSKTSADKKEPTETKDSKDDKVEIQDIVTRLHSLTISELETHCQSKFTQTSTHISALPIEIMMFIIQWVVSNELDMRSLEQLSMVCRGFYVCARDPEIWKMACISMWGINCHLTKEYNSWREMFINRPHLKTNGVYISKASYVRHGERSLDQFYRPWHTVEYYRYIRAFPDGELQMVTSPDDPYMIISKLKTKCSKISGIMHGHYRMVGDKVFAVFQKFDYNMYDRSVRRYRRNRNNTVSDTEQTFHVELTVQTIGHKAQAKLIWDQYSSHTYYRSTGLTSTSEFELDVNRYPPFYFSRVKSYMATTNSPLTTPTSINNQILK